MRVLINVDKQTAVSLTMKSGRNHIILTDLDSMNKIFSDFSDFNVSKTGLTSVDPRISLMGQEILSQQNPKNRAETDFYLSGWNFATFLDRVSSFESLADHVNVTQDGRVLLKYVEAKKSDSALTSCIIKLEDKLGGEHYLVVKNEDVDKIFAGIYSDSSPIVQATSENLSIYLVAQALDYNDVGGGQLTGIYYLTNTNFAIFMNNFESMQVIRTGVSIEPNGYIVGNGSK